MAYLQGTKSGCMAGGALTSNDLIPAGGFSKTQTGMADICQPPSKPASSAGTWGMVGVFFGLIIDGVLFFAFWIDSLSAGKLVILGSIFFGSLILGYVIGGLAGKDHECQQAYEREVNYWQKKWICMACGKIWIPKTQSQKTRIADRDGWS